MKVASKLSRNPVHEQTEKHTDRQTNGHWRLHNLFDGANNITLLTDAKMESSVMDNSPSRET